MVNIMSLHAVLNLELPIAIVSPGNTSGSASLPRAILSRSKTRGCPLSVNGAEDERLVQGSDLRRTLGQGDCLEESRPTLHWIDTRLRDRACDGHAPDRGLLDRHGNLRRSDIFLQLSRDFGCQRLGRLAGRGHWTDQRQKHAATFVNLHVPDGQVGFAKHCDLQPVERRIVALARGA